jgi:hypothetical protein
VAVVAKEAAVAARAAVEKAVEKAVEMAVEKVVEKAAVEKAAVETAQLSRGKTPMEMSRGATYAFCATKTQRRQPSKEDKNAMCALKPGQAARPPNRLPTGLSGHRAARSRFFAGLDAGNRTTQGLHKAVDTPRHEWVSVSHACPNTPDYERAFLTCALKR